MTNYPNQIDTNAELPAVHDNVSEVSVGLLNAIRDTLITIETTLGLNPQGSAMDVVSRLNAALNADGTIRDDALPSTLVDLPITNAQIATTAAIEESKLDLDVSTSFLQSQITSNDIDITQLQTGLAALLVRYARHVAGTGERHISSHIDHAVLSDGYVLGPGTTAKTVLNYLSGQMNLHRKEPDVWQHFASAIRYIPTTTIVGGTPVITATNVQDAITSIETDFIEDRRKHNDEAHDDGVSNDGYVALNGQAVVNDASLKLTRYQPASIRDVIKIGLCNSAVIKSKGFDPTALSANDSDLDIEVEVGGVSRTLSLTGLQTTVYPVGITQKSLDGVVDLMNAKFADSGVHFPLTAFASEDGEIVIQHNLAHIDSSITIRDPGATSAVDALGFTDLVDVKVGRLQNFAYTINGIRYTELNTLADGYSTHAGTTIVDLGITVDNTGLDLKVGSLVHIYDHDSSEANGTYQVQGVGTTVVELTESLINGGFRFVLYDDTLDTSDFVNPQRATLDFYLDEDRVPITSTRANITYSTVDGFWIVEVSQNFPDFTGFVNVTGTTTKTVELEDDLGNSGVSVSFEPGFIGYLRLYAPDNISYVTIFVYRVTIVNGTASLTIFGTEANDDRLLLGTSHVDAAGNDVEIPLNRRNIGLVAEKSIGSEFHRNVLERDIRNFHINGLVRGFDILSTTSNSVRVEGGQAYIDGRWVERSTTVIDVDITSDGTYNLVLTKQGNYNIFEEGVGSGNSFSVAEIIVADDAILIAQITVASSVVSDTLDARFFINDLENKLQLTVDNRDLGAGTFRSLESAVLYSNNVPNDTKPEITLLSDLTIPDDLTIGANTRIVAFGDLTVESDLTLGAGSTLIIFGNFLATGSNTVTVGTSASLFLENTSSFAGTIVLGTNSSLHFADAATFVDTITTGEGCVISGNEFQPVMTFAGTSEGISVDDGYVTIRDLDLQMTNGVGSIGENPIILMTQGADFLTVNNCKFSQTGTVSESNWATPATDFERTGILRFDLIPPGTFITDMTVTNCDFRNLYSGITVQDFKDTLINECRFENHVSGIVISDTVAEGGDRTTIKNSLFSNIRDEYILVNGDNAYIDNNNFREEFKATSPPVIIIINDSGVISNNQFLNIRVDNGISTSDAFVAIEGNYFDSCISESYLLDATTLSGEVSIQHNYILNHQGQVLVATGNNATFSNNLVEVVDVIGGATTMFNIGQGSRQNILSSNTIDLTTGVGPNTTLMTLNECLLLTNFISCGSLTISPSGVATDQLVISSNTFNLKNGGILVEGSKDGSVIIANNNILAQPGNFIPLEVEDTATGGATKGTIIANNNIQGDLGVNAITCKVGTSGLGSTGRWLITGNTIHNGTSRGIEVFADNVTITDNITIGSIGTDIFMDSSVTNAYVTDNQVGNGGVTHGAVAPLDVYIGPNKGANSFITTPSWNTYLGVSTDWNISSDAVNNSVGAGADSIYLPLNLPVGVEIVQVDTLITATALNSFSVALYRRNSGASLSTALFTVLSPAGHGTGFLTGTPSSTLYIEAQAEYFLKISSATVNDKLYQVVTTVKY